MDEMRFLLGKLNTPFAKKWGAFIGFAILLLFLANPELFSVALLADAIGIDVIILLLGIQLRHQWSMIDAFIITPCYFKVKRFFGP